MADPSFYVPFAVNFATICECNTFKENSVNSYCSPGKLLSQYFNIETVVLV